MQIDDLSPLGTNARFVAVGWLARGDQHPTGPVAPGVFAKLEALLTEPWQPAVAGGSHPCDLCVFRAEKWGVNNVFVPGDGRVYVAPELILHYMNAHQYQPPPEFCEAVLSCPSMRSVAYRRALLRAGGPDFVKQAGAALVGSSLPRGVPRHP